MIASVLQISGKDSRWLKWTRIFWTNSMKARRSTTTQIRPTTALTSSSATWLSSAGTSERFQASLEPSQERSPSHWKTSVEFQLTGNSSFQTIQRLKWNPGLILESQVRKRHLRTTFLKKVFSMYHQEVARWKLENKWRSTYSTIQKKFPSTIWKHSCKFKTVSHWL